MKFSEAMRLGAMVLPPVYGPIFDYNSNNEVCGACAIGSPLYIVTQQRLDNMGLNGCFDLIEQFWPWTHRVIASPEVFLGVEHSIPTIVMILFEMHHWSRERIADWIETLEAQYDTSTTSRKDEPYDIEATLSEVTTSREHSR